MHIAVVIAAVVTLAEDGTYAARLCVHADWHITYWKRCIKNRETRSLRLWLSEGSSCFWTVRGRNQTRLSACIFAQVLLNLSVFLASMRGGRCMPIVLLALFLPNSLRAALIAYDGADYAPTNSVSGLNGGTGWDGGWSGNNSVVAGSLRINGVATNGNRFVTDGNNDGSSRVIATNGFGDLLQNGRFGKAGTTLWLSYLFRAVTTSSNNQAGILLYDGAVNQVLYIGVPTGGATLGLFATTNSAPPFGASSLSEIVATNQQTLFIVIKMMFGTANGDRMFMYVNPPLDHEPTNDIYISAALNNLSFQFDRLLFASGATTTTASFDEFRLGETFADVAPLAPDRYAVTELASLPAPGPPQYSISPLLQDTQGRLFGSRLTGGANGMGDLFRAEENGSGFTPLHEFPATAGDGTSPEAPLLASDGMLYGGTIAGGTGGLFGNYGVLYRMNTDGSGYMILRELDSQADGTEMAGALLQDTNAVLYGALRNGGTPNTDGNGTLFKMNTNGTGFTVLHIFTNSVIVPSSIDGWDPEDPLIEGPDHLLYGTTHEGGTAGSGTVFRIGKDGSGYQIIWHFQNDGTGSHPESRLLYGSDGYLYGTTVDSSPGAGATIYKLKPDGTEYQVLGKFGGAHLQQGSLLEMPDGLLYGTASEGGRPIPPSGYLFRIAKDGSDFEVLYEFQPTAPNGQSPWGGFLKGRDGALYGTTVAGGTNGAGVIYKLAQAGAQINPPVTLFPLLVAGSNTFQLSFTGVPLGQYEIQGTGQLPSG